MVNHFKQNLTFGGSFKAFAEVNSEYPAFYYGDKVETWKEVDERTNSLANALLDLGFKKGDNCALLLPNCPEYMETLIAGFKTGIVPISGVNYRYIPKEMHYVIDSTDSKILVLDEDYVDRINQIRPNLNKLEECIVVGENVPDDMLSYEDLIRKYPKTDPKLEWEIKPEDDSIIIMTGGTTGLPKGVLWSQEGLMMSLGDALFSIIGNMDKILGYITEDTLRYALKALMPPLAGLSPLLASIIRSGVVREILKRPTTAVLVDSLLHFIMCRGFMGRFTHNLKCVPASPLFHGASTYTILPMMLQLGGSVVFLTKKEGIDVEEYWKTIAEKRANVAMTVGDAFAKPMLEYLDEHHGELDLTPFLVMVSVGAGLTAENKRKLIGYIPSLLIADMFGSTEVTTKSGAMAVREKLDEMETMKFGSVASDVLKRVKVLNLQTGKEVKRGSGEVGELVYSGTSGAIAKGYYGDPEKTAQCFRTIDGERYFFVGDGATVDEDGSIRMLGRLSGVVNTGGEKVYPEELEEIIKNHPKVAQVAITGVPDERWGEAVTAVIKLKEGEKATEDEMIDYCRDKMAGFKRPKHVFFVPEVPISGSGKAERPKVKYIAKVIYEEDRIPTEDELIEAHRKGKGI